MDLTAGNVQTLIKHCLPLDVTEEQKAKLESGEEIDGLKPVRGVVGGFCFVKTKLEEKREDVRSMLSKLPKDFHKDKGGGWTFLNACMTASGEQWGDHRNIEELLCLGIGLGLAEFQLPREAWKALPDGMPYFSVSA